MHDKLKLLLDKIHMNEDYYAYFTDGVLDKIVISKSNKNCLFKLSLKSTLNIDVYNDFNSLINKTFTDNEKILSTSLIIKYENSITFL